MSTKWQQFLKDFGRSEGILSLRFFLCVIIIYPCTDGKTAICSGLPVFMSAAKEAYSRLTESERDALRPQASHLP